jgi:hypothetical protein
LTRDIENISNSFQYRKFPEHQGHPKVESEMIVKEDASLSMSVKQELTKPPSQSAYVSSKQFVNQRSFL